MPTIFVKGDIFATPDLRAYAHGCNCSGTMDTGISVAFKKRWPQMFEEYRLLCEDKRFRLGDVFVWNDGNDVIYNLGLQEHWKTPAKIAALAKALKKMIELASGVGIKAVGLPRLGTGLGGLDWTRAKKLLSEHGEGTNLSLVVFEQFVRAPTSAP